MSAQITSRDQERYEVRQVGLEHLDQLMAWRKTVLEEVFDHPSHREMRQLLAANRAYYEAAIVQEQHVACFAYEDGIPVACGGMCIQPEMPSPDNPQGTNAYLMNIYTTPAHRGKGAGKAVVEWLVEQARIRNIGKIYLEATPLGRELYETVGFVDYPDIMHLPCADPLKQS